MGVIVALSIGMALGFTAGWLVTVNNAKKAARLRREAADMYERAMILAERAADRLAELLQRLDK